MCHDCGFKISINDRFVCMKFGDRVFYPSGIMGKKIQWKKDHHMFQKWKGVYLAKVL